MAINITLNQWKVFQAIVEEGGYAQAAQKLHRSQSAISYSISKMQDQLGVSLLEVQGRKAVLTEAGTLLLRRAHALLDEAAGLEAAAASLQIGWEAEVSIAVDAIFPMHYLLQALDELQRIAPHTRIEIIESVLSGTEELIAQKKVDLAIAGPPNLEIIGIPLMEIEFAPVCAPTHALVNLNRPATLQDLKKQRQIVVRDSGADRRYSPGWQKAEKRWTFSHIGSALEAIESGFGFSWTAVNIISEELEKGSITIIDMDLPVRKKIPLYLFSPDPDGQGPAAKALASILLQSAQNS